MRLEIVDIANDRQLLNYVLTKNQLDSVFIYRFYNLAMIGEEVNGLMPDPNIVIPIMQKYNYDGDDMTREVDIAYAKQLMTNKKSFLDLMTIMQSLMCNNHVIILSNYTHPNVFPIVDSLIKFIQERYSIYTYIINDIMDIDENKISAPTTKIGASNIMHDLEVYRDILSKDKNLNYIPLSVDEEI